MPNLVEFERSLHSAQVGGQSCPRPLKLMTLKVVESTWTCMGGYGRLRGEWVNNSFIDPGLSQRFQVAG